MASHRCIFSFFLARSAFVTSARGAQSWIENLKITGAEDKKSRHKLNRAMGHGQDSWVLTNLAR